MTKAYEVDVDFSGVVYAKAGPSGAVPIFTCSSSNCEVSGSVAITAEAVYIGEDRGVFRVETSKIRIWYTESRGSLFALTVVSDRPYVTLLFTQLRTTVSGVLTRTVGPKRRILLTA